MSVKTEHEKQLARVAKQYRIELVLTNRARHRLGGPGGYAGLSVKNRIVHYGSDAHPHHVLHELVHIVTKPPGISIAALPEDFVLLQFERALARTLAPVVYKHVVRWQEDTETPSFGLVLALGEVPNYTHAHPWRAGFDRARRLGLLNKHNRPTGKLPRWTPVLIADAKLCVKEAR